MACLPRRLPLLLGALCLAVILAASLAMALPAAVGAEAADATATTNPASADRAAVEALLGAYFEAFRRRDLPAMEKLWVHGDDVTVIENGVAEYGWERLYGYHLLPEFRAAVRLEIEPADLRIHVAGDLAWTTWTYHGRITLADRTIDSTGAATLLARREADGWRILHTHMSGQRPAP